MSDSGSERSQGSTCTEACPVSPSLLYDQRAQLYETRRYLRNRRALTAYHRTKRDHTIEEASCLILGEQGALLLKQGDVESGLPLKIAVSHRSQTYRLREKQ
jgi:hypothetical protein